MKFARLAIVFIFLALSVNHAAAQTRVRTFDVEHYTIRTSFDRANKTVFGETTVRLKPLAADFKTVQLDHVNLNVEAVTLAGKSLQFVADKQNLVITLDKNYAPTDSIEVTVKYRAVKPTAGIRFVEPLRRNDREVRSAQIWSQGEPEENKHWFPAYDSPDDKATSEQFITVEKDETAIANGDLIETKENPNGTRTFHFKMAQPHATYLTSLVVGKYARVADKYGNIPLGFYVYPGTESIVPRAYGKTKQMFAFFEDKLAVKFPFKKYDQTVVGNFDFGGMENITATTMDELSIYAARDDKNLPETENLVSHELAHSWFGNLVTCKNWSNLWLNEGFATFFEAAFIESDRGRAAYLREMSSNAEQYQREDLAVKHPLLNLRAQPNALLFDATTYKKGGFVVHMLRETVGDEIFWKSLNVYLNRHKYQNVETADLQRAFEETSGKNLDWFFEQWVRKAGYPRIKIEPEYNPATKKIVLLVRQTQKADSLTPEWFRFSAEIEFVTATGTKTEKIEMTAREQTFSFDLAAKPTEINFDKREQVLDLTDVNDVSEVRGRSVAN